MNADTDQHHPKREMILSLDFQMLQEVVVEDLVIAPFAGSTLAASFLIQSRIPGNVGLEPQVGIVFDVNSPAVLPFGTFFRIWTGINPSTF